MRAFGLGGLLRVRARLEDEARRELGAAQGGVTAARERVVARKAELAGMGAPDGGPASTFLAQVAARSAVAAAVTVAVADEELARDQLLVARDAWTAARARARAVERLRDRHEALQRADEARAEQHAHDDLAGARHHARAAEASVRSDDEPGERS